MWSIESPFIQLVGELADFSCCVSSQMQIYCYDPHRFGSLDEATAAGGSVTALAVLFEVSSS